MQDLTGLLSFGTPVGVTERILIQNLYLFFFSDTGVPVGTTEQIQRYP